MIRVVIWSSFQCQICIHVQLKNLFSTSEKRELQILSFYKTGLLKKVLNLSSRISITKTVLPAGLSKKKHEKKMPLSEEKKKFQQKKSTF